MKLRLDFWLTVCYHGYSSWDWGWVRERRQTEEVGRWGRHRETPRPDVHGNVRIQEGGWGSTHKVSDLGWVDSSCIWSWVSGKLIKCLIMGECKTHQVSDHGWVKNKKNKKLNQKYSFQCQNAERWRERERKKEIVFMLQ